MKAENSNRRLKLPDYYTNIQPVDKKSPAVPSVEAQTVTGDV